MLISPAVYGGRAIESRIYEMLSLTSLPLHFDSILHFHHMLPSTRAHFFISSDDAAGRRADMLAAHSATMV